MSGDLSSYVQRKYGVGSEEKKKLKKQQQSSKVTRLGNFSLVDDDEILVKAKSKREKKKNTGVDSDRRLLASEGWTSHPLIVKASSSPCLEQERNAAAAGTVLIEKDVHSHLFSNTSEQHSVNVDEDGDIDFSSYSVARSVNSKDETPSEESKLATDDSSMKLKVGLQNVDEIKVWNRKMKESEETEILADQESLGKNSSTVYRDLRGKKLSSYKEYVDSRKRKSIFRDEPEYTWGAGIVQKQLADEEKERLVSEKDREFAVYKTNEELNQRQRQQLRWGDPLLTLPSQKRKNTSQVSDSVSSSREGDYKFNPNVVSNDRYRGPPPPPNRFNIEPGPRWDGIDRSNGFEKKVFDRVAKKKAFEEYAYKISVEDM